MDAFWCITLSVLLLRWWWKRNKAGIIQKEEKKEEVEPPKLNIEAAKEMQQENKDKQVLADEQKKLDKQEREKQRQHDKDVAELKRQGYTDELIAVIIPTINNK